MPEDQEQISKFKPSYVWPNPAFHFRHYFNDEKCRIFLIENIAHNWNWLSRYCVKFKKNDYFIVQLGWYFDEHLVSECSKIFNILDLKRERFYFMFPDFAAKTLFEYYGFKGEIINHNCFLDEKLFHVDTSKKKIYEAIYTARRAPFKRHYLASDVKGLALIAGDNSAASIDELPAHIYLNERHLNSNEVIDKLHQSKVGLILSEFEGACYSSSEYLLCGLPVVSTRSHGGRDIWYNSYNSIVCDPTPESVSEAVLFMCSLNRDPHRIRQMHIDLANVFRNNFLNILKCIFSECNISVDETEYWEKNFKHKMLTSETPDFELIF